MSGGLRELLGLPLVNEVLKSRQAAEFGQKFRTGIAGLNSKTQVAAAQANAADAKPLDSQKQQLFDAFHKASALIDPNDATKADPAIQRVISAVSTVDLKASAVISGLAVGRAEWLKREADLDKALLQIGELEDAGHPKADALRKLGDAIRNRAKGKKYQESVAALDQLRPKLDVLLLQVEPLDGRKTAPSPEAVRPAALTEEILKLIAERMDVGIDELGDLSNLPKNVLDIIQQISKLSPGGLIASELSEQVEALLGKLIDVFRDILAKRRTKLACLVSVHNNTTEAITLADATFVAKRGNWSPGQTPKNTIGPGETDTFQAESPRHAKVYGVVARLTYIINDNKVLEWSVDFSNPRDRQIKAESKLKGAREKEFKTPQPQPTTGDTATFAFQLNLASDPNPTEPVHPEVPAEPENPSTPDKPAPIGPDAASSCHVTITNNTKVTLTLASQGHERGDFMTFPGSSLAAGASTSFVSVETPNAKDANDEGCKGFLLWEVGSPDVQWRVEWDNPEGGKNLASASLNPKSTALTSLNQIGQGEENVPTAFTLSGDASGGGVTPTNEKREGLSILVKDRVTGEGIQGASIKVGDQSDKTGATGVGTVELPKGNHSYEAAAGGYHPAAGAVEVVEGDNPELVIEMSPDGSSPRQGLTAIVIDQDSRKPVSAVEVSIADQADTTSSNGLATFELPVGSHDFTAVAQNFRVKRGTVQVIDGDNPELVIELTKDGQKTNVVFMVTDEAGDPIEGASVVAGNDQTDTTDKSGFAGVEVEAGNVHFTVKKEGFETVQDTVEIEEGSSEIVPVVLKKASKGKTKVAFMVTDEAGDPIEGASVTAGADQTDTTDANGFAGVEVEAGNLPFAVEKEGFDSVEDSVDIEEGSSEIVPVVLKKEEKNVEFDPPPESKQPTLKKGAESADGWVEYLQKLLNKTLGPGTVDVNGKFDDKTYQAVKKFQGSTTPPCLIDGIVGNETWSMLRKGEREKVGVNKKSDEKGQEARWATEKTDFVTYRSDANIDEIWMMAFSVGDTPLDPKTPITVRMAGADGSNQKAFALELGPAAKFGDGQEYVLKIKKVAERFGTGDLPVEAYFPKDLGGDLWKGTVPVSGLKGGGKGGGGGNKDEVGELKVAVVWAGKGPAPADLSGYDVIVSNGAQGTTDAKGIAILSDVAAGQATVACNNGTSGGSAKVTIQAGQSNSVTIKVKENKGEPPQTDTATLEVHVSDPEGDTAAGIKVRITGGPSTPPDGSTDSSGVARFQLEPGDYIVNAAFRAAVFEPAQVKKSSLVPGKTFVLRMKKLATGFLTVSVMRNGPDGKPVAEPDATVTVTKAVHAPQKTDGSGSAFFALPPGSYQVSAVSADGQSQGSAQATLEKGQPTQAAIIFQDGGGEETPKTEKGTVIMNVIDAVTGESVNATIMFIGPGNTTPASRTKFVFDKPGEYEYSVRAPKYMNSDGHVTVVAGATIPHRVEMQMLIL